MDRVAELLEENKRLKAWLHNSKAVGDMSVQASFALIEENKRLREAIEKAPHGPDCPKQMVHRDFADRWACQCVKAALFQHTEVDHHAE